MKKKLLTLILALCLALPLALGLVGCDSGDDHTMTQAKWNARFTEVNFYAEWAAEDSDRDFLTVTETSYHRFGEGECGYEIVDGEKVYYKFPANGDDEQPLDPSEYIDYLTPGAELMTFLKGLYANSEKLDTDNRDIQAKSYTGEIPTPVRAFVESLIGREYEYHSIVILLNYEQIVGIYFFESQPIFDERGYFNRETSDHAISFHDFGSCIENETLIEARFYKTFDAAFEKLADFENGSTFKVVGGKGADYMEYYFSKNGMIMLTPNAVVPNVGTDICTEAIFYTDNTTYTYYRKTKEGVWSSQTLSESQFKERKASIYENYGGALIEQENKYGYDNGKYWDVQNIGATLGRYEQVRTYVNEDKEITKITWNFVYKAGVTYKFTLTVCDFTITPPTV